MNTKKRTKGKFILKLAGFLELLIGALTIGLVCYALADGTIEMTIGSVAIHQDSVLSVILLIALAIFQMISGFVAIVYANSRKMSDTCLMLGMILLFLQVLTLNKLDRSLEVFIVDLLGLAVPFIYLYGAAKIKKEK